MNSRRDYPLVFILTVFAVAVRAQLTYNSGIWADEGLVFSIVSIPSWGGMFDFLAKHESHPPLFYILVRGWRSMFGASDTATLALPVLLGALIVPALYFSGRSLYSRGAGLIAAILGALSPSLAEHSSQLRPYGLLPVLALGTSVALIRAIETRRWKTWLAYSAVVALLLYTHHWSWLVIGGQGVALLLICMKLERTGSLKLLGSAAVAGVVALLLYAPWLPVFLHQSAHAGHLTPLLIGIGGRIGFIVFGGISLPYMLFTSSVMMHGVAYLALLAAAILALLDVRLPIGQDDQPKEHDPGIRRKVLVTAPIISLVVALVVSLQSELIIDRCVVILAPSLMVAFAGWSVQSLGRSQLTPASSRLRSSFLTMVIGASVAGLVALLPTRRSNTREVASRLMGYLDSGDVVIVAPEWRTPAFNHYFPAGYRQIDYPYLGRAGLLDFADVIQRGTDTTNLPVFRSTIQRARAEQRRVWFVTARPYLKMIDDAYVKLTPEQRDQLVAVKNVGLVRDELISVYGPPDSSRFLPGKTPRYEEMLPLLFTPQK